MCTNCTTLSQQITPYMFVRAGITTRREQNILLLHLSVASDK